MDLVWPIYRYTGSLALERKSPHPNQLSSQTQLAVVPPKRTLSPESNPGLLWDPSRSGMYPACPRRLELKWYFRRKKPWKEARVSPWWWRSGWGRKMGPSV